MGHVTPTPSGSRSVRAAMRTEHRPHEGLWPCALHPGVEVVRDRAEVEAGILGPNREFDELPRAPLLAGERVTEIRHCRRLSSLVASMACLPTRRRANSRSPTGCSGYGRTGDRPMNDASDPKAPRPEDPASGRETVPEDDDEVAAAAETVERTLAAPQAESRRSGHQWRRHGRAAPRVRLRRPLTRRACDRSVRGDRSGKERVR